MKNFLYIAFLLVLTLNAFTQEIPLGHAPAEHSAVLHINVKRVMNVLNVTEAERLLLIHLHQMLEQGDYQAIKKVFTETIPQLRESGFDIYNNIHDLVVSGDIKSQESVIIGLYGQFNRETFARLATDILNMQKYEQSTDIEVYYRPLDKIFIHYYSETTVLMAPSLENIRKAIQALKSGNNILGNIDFKTIYNRSDKNKAINIIAAIKMQQSPMQNQQDQGGGIGAGAGAMLLMFMQNLKGINITIDFPQTHRIYIKVFCKDPNTAASIGALVMQQLPMLVPTLTQELGKTNRKIALLSRGNQQDAERMRRLWSERYKKYILLLAVYAGNNNIRINNLGNDLTLQCTWPRNVVQNAIISSGIPFNLNLILK